MVRIEAVTKAVIGNEINANPFDTTPVMIIRNYYKDIEDVERILKLSKFDPPKSKFIPSKGNKRGFR